MWRGSARQRAPRTSDSHGRGRTSGTQNESLTWLDFIVSKWLRRFEGHHFPLSPLLWSGANTRAEATYQVCELLTLDGRQRVVVRDVEQLLAGLRAHPAAHPHVHHLRVCDCACEALRQIIELPAGETAPKRAISHQTMTGVPPSYKTAILAQSVTIVPAATESAQTSRNDDSCTRHPIWGRRQCCSH